MGRPEAPTPVAGASGGGSGSGSGGGTGGATTTEPVPGAGGNAGAAEPPRTEAGSTGGPVTGQPSLFDELVGTSPSRNDVPGGEVCERIATIQCAGEASCCAAPGRSFEDCKRTMKQGCVERLFLDRIMTDPIVSYDRVVAAAVFEEYEARARRCDVDVAFWGASNDGFRALTRGTIAQGAACQPPAFELVAPGAVAAAHLLACTSPQTHACLPLSAPWTCAPRAAEGGVCFVDTNCNDDLFCTNSGERNIAGGTCSVRKPDGAPCDFPSACQSFACKSGTCAPKTQQAIYCLQ